MPAISTIDPELYKYCTPRQKEILEAIELLNDLRTAVISAAVTGKIDVREEVR
jgi:hypothetical protein